MQASLKNALDEISGTPAYGSRDIGALMATPFALNITQFNNISAGLTAFENNVTNNAIKYQIFGDPNCINFVYDMANAAANTDGSNALAISSTQNLLGFSVPSLAANNIVSYALSHGGTAYEYFGPKSWNSPSGQSSIQTITSFDNLASIEDEAIQLCKALINDGIWIDNAIGSEINQGATWINKQVQGLLNNQAQWTLTDTSGDQIIETIGGTQSPETIEYFNSSETPVEQVTFNSDGSYAVDVDDSSGNLSVSLAGSANGTNNVIAAASGAVVTLSSSGNAVTLSPNASVSDTPADLSTDTLTFDLANNGAITFGAGTFSPSASQYADSGTISMPLVYSDPMTLGTLSVTASSDADSLTLTDGMVITLPNVVSDTLTAISNPTTTTPEQALLAYLSDLGDSTTSANLVTLNHNYLSSEGLLTGGDTATQFAALSGLTGTGVIDAVSGGAFNLATKNPNADYNMVALDWSGTQLTGNNQNNEVLQASLFGADTLQAGNGTGDTLDAGEGVDTLIGGTGGDTFNATNGLAVGSSIQGNGAGNLLVTGGDISGATISGVQTLFAGNITLNATEFNEFSAITGAGTISASTGGIYSLQSKGTVQASMIALSNTGTTLIGNGGSGTTLTASATGNDTLENGGTLVAGGGVDTLENATTAIATNGLATGSTVENVTTLETNGNISGDTISGIGTLALTGGDSISLTAAQFATIGTIEAPAGSLLTAATGGIYNITSKLPAQVYGGPLDMTALSNAGTTLEEDAVGGEVTLGVTLTASSGGNDTLISNNTGGVTLDADNSTGNVTMTSTGSTGNDLTAEDSTGNDILTTTGDNNILDVLGSTGTDTLTAVSGSNAGLNVTIYAGNGTDTIIGGYSSTIYSGGGADTIYGGGAMVLDEGSGTDTVYTSGGIDTITGGTGNDTYVVNVSLAAGSSIAGGGGSDVLNVIAGTLFDISLATITGVQTLNDNAAGLSLTASELSGFANLINPFGTSGYAYLFATTAGSYSLAGKNLTGNFDLSAFYTTANVTLIGNTQNGQVLIGGAGTDTLQAGSGNGDLLVASSGTTTLIAGTGTDTLTGGTGSDTFILGGSSGIAQVSLAGDVVTFSGTEEVLAFTGGDSVVVQSGTQATIVGSNGTMTVNNDASGGVVQNTINLTAGGSEVETFTNLTGGGKQELDLGYTGSNGTGTQTYSQTTTTASNGTITAAISGLGDVSGLSSSTITVANSASSTFTGSHNTVAGGNSDTITITSPASSDFTYFGSSNTINDGGTSDSIVAYGNGNTIKLTGASDNAVDASPSTGSNSFLVSGASDTVSLAEAGDTVTVSGSNDTATERSTGQSATVTGTGDTLTDLGSGTITNSITGTNDTAYISNSGDVTTVGGSYNTAYLFNANTTLNLAGTYNTGVAYGSNDIINVTGTNDTGNDYANGGDQVFIEGTGDNAIITKSNDSSTIGGSGNTAEVLGTGDTVTVTGNHNTVSDYLTTGGNSFSVSGSNNSVGTYNSDTVTFGSGANSDTASIGSSNTVNDGGASDSTVAYGSGNTITMTGTGDSATDASPSTGSNSFVLAGSTDRTSLAEAHDTATLSGSHDTVTAYVGNETVNISGTSDTASDATSTGANSFSVTGSGNTIAADNNDTIALLTASSSNFDWMISGDTVNDGGTSNHTVTYGSGDTVTVTGTSGLVTDAGTGSNTITLNGSSDTAVISNTTSDTITVGGSSNTVDIQNSVTGTKTATINGTNALLQFAGATTDQILFGTGATGRLLLNSASNFAGTVAGMASGDSVDLANFLFSGTPTISSVTGTGASGTPTDVTITDGSAHLVLALINQFANQFAVSSSAYTLTADGTGGSAGTLFQLAAGH
jgi:hypothetical protein